MKKYFVLAFILCAAWFGFSTEMQGKDYAEKLDAGYLQPAQQLMTEALGEDLLAQIGETGAYDELITPEMAVQLKDKYTPEIENLLRKLEQEKPNEQTEALQAALRNTLDSLAEAFSLAANLNNGKDSDKLDDALVNYVEDYYRCQNEISLLVNGKTSYELTARNFQQIKEGDSYYDAVQKLKMPGVLEKSRQSVDFWGKKTVYKTYRWQDGGKNVIVDLENGKVVSLLQYGLE